MLFFQISIILHICGRQFRKYAIKSPGILPPTDNHSIFGYILAVFHADGCDYTYTYSNIDAPFSFIALMA